MPSHGSHVLFGGAPVTHGATGPVVHLVHGLPGTGKTHFARELAERTGAVLLNHDHIRVVLYGPNPPSEGFELATGRIHELIWEMAGQFLRHGVPVILDHGFWTRASRDEARQRVADLGAQVLFYEMECRPELADARVMVRNRANEPGTLIIAPGALDLFRSRFEPMQPDEPRTVVRSDPGLGG